MNMTAALPGNDQQFYPTPPELAEQLTQDVEWEKVHSLLEPSAGRGDLIEFAKQKVGNLVINNRRRCYEINDIDCIEIDPNLQAILLSKGFRIVDDNFLNYNSRKRYDLILMNPPFAQGDLHLLHAIDLCEHGGEIACILNAETLRNPYTNTRKLLLQKLQDVSANIRYVKDGFKNGDRSTCVETALIHIKIPSVGTDDSWLKNMERSMGYEAPEIGSNEIAPSDNIERMIREYRLACDAGISAIQKVKAVQNRIEYQVGEKYVKPVISISISGVGVEGSSASVINHFLSILRGRFWKKLFDLPEVKCKMTSKISQQFDSIVSEMADYEFSMFNIRQVMGKIDGQLAKGMEESILECFEKLSNAHAYNESVENGNIHYFNGWKSNKAHFVNSKCVIPAWGCFARRFKKDKYGRWKDVFENLDQFKCFNLLSDLEKSLDYLDKGETCPSPLESNIQNAISNGQTKVSCKYFDVTFYKKGTCHIKFKNQRILDRLNIFAARQKAWLPPTYGRTHYADMDAESQRVVDEFQGREKYEEIMNAPQCYIVEPRNAYALLT